MKRVCVFCGSNLGSRPTYRLAAEIMGKTLAQHQIELVYGGGNVGLMGTVADAVLATGGQVIGVIPEALLVKEVAHAGLTTLHVVGSMHERKALMADLSDGFIALPGGWGTFEELCEVLTWSQLGLHQKPCGLLNVDGYYDALITLFDHAVQEEFLRSAHRTLALTAQDPEQLLEQMTNYRPILVDKWIAKDLKP